VNRLTFIKQLVACKFRFLSLWTFTNCVPPQSILQSIESGLRWMRTSFIFLLFTISLTIHPSAYSSVEKALEPPAGLEALTKPRFIGQHRFTFFGLDIYHISLWSSPGWTPEKWNQHSFALSLVYSRNLSGEEIAKRSISEIKKQIALDDDRAKQWMSQLLVLMPSVKPGDRLTGVYQPSGTLAFWIESKKLGEINDPKLSEAFMGIWLSTKTSEPKMREKLLGMYLEQ